MRRNPLLYSDQTEVEEINTIEPIEEKRSFIFYFIVLANSLLVIIVLLVIWSLFTKSSGTSLDQQLKTWTQQIFNPTETIELKTPIVPTVKAADVNTQTKLAATKEKELEQLRIEKDNIEKKLALKAEQEKLEMLTLKLKEEKAKADAIQQAASEAKVTENIAPQEAAVVPNADKNIPEQPGNTAKTQLEQILETMQNQ